MTKLSAEDQERAKDYEYTAKEPIYFDQYALHATDRSIIIQLAGQVNRINEVLLQDRLLRKNNPALQDAWEKYQTIRNLTAHD